MMYGPTNPPRLPIELINAMLAAAAVPVRKIVGSAQNGGGNEYNAMVAIENAPMASARWFPAHTLIASATPTSRIGMAACHRRSPVLSECHAEISIAGMAASQGIPEISVTSKVGSPEMRCTIFGNQKARPTLFVM